MRGVACQVRNSRKNETSRSNFGAAAVQDSGRSGSVSDKRSSGLSSVTLLLETLKIPEAFGARLPVEK